MEGEGVARAGILIPDSGLILGETRSLGSPLHAGLAPLARIPPSCCWCKPERFEGLKVLMDYDFSQLSAYEFEQLVSDLFTAERGCRHEVFMPGPDGGVDIRRISPDGGSSIVQCKHYLRSEFSVLLRDLKKEVPKVVKLAPASYEIVSSVPMSVGRKSKIRKALSPLVLSDDQVWGQEDLNALLRKHQDVLKAHHKLWIASADVLLHLFTNDIVGRSESLLRDIEHRARLYSMNSGVECREVV